ncbi:unnamed protein product [Prorocentrum cordatum]|uniref:Uncharacterized protein n=1 Tax=Prorocentrum cordatum TaxID=2364126 RepID=A0ABN9PCM8_9DINO|nr:unnamed protein product [Polarella glacialis]
MRPRSQYLAGHAGKLATLTICSSTEATHNMHELLKTLNHWRWLQRADATFYAARSAALTPANDKLSNIGPATSQTEVESGITSLKPPPRKKRLDNKN